MMRQPCYHQACRKKLTAFLINNTAVLAAGKNSRPVALQPNTQEKEESSRGFHYNLQIYSSSVQNGVLPGHCLRSQPVCLLTSNGSNYCALAHLRLKPFVLPDLLSNG